MFSLQKILSASNFMQFLGIAVLLSGPKNSVHLKSFAPNILQLTSSVLPSSSLQSICVASIVLHLPPLFVGLREYFLQINALHSNFLHLVPGLKFGSVQTCSWHLNSTHFGFSSETSRHVTFFNSYNAHALPEEESLHCHWSSVSHSEPRKRQMNMSIRNYILYHNLDQLQ